MNLKKYFRSEQQYRLFGVLVLASMLVWFMVIGRWYLNRVNLPEDIRSYDQLVAQPFVLTFVFLIWNLILAWIPYILAIQITYWYRKGISLKILALPALVWLLFFPNAPYIITDFVHFRSRPPVPLWYDLVLMFTTAFTGFMLGLLSLYEMQGLVRQQFGRWKAYAGTALALALCGFGIWLGRFQRWNSWDVVSNPGALVEDLLAVLSEKSVLLHAVALSTGFSLIVLLGYLMVAVMLERES